MAALALFEGEDGSRGEVLVHEHAVVDVLVVGHGCEDHVFCRSFKLQGRIEQGAAVVAKFTTDNLLASRLLTPHLLTPHLLIIIISVLIAVFEACLEVDEQSAVAHFAAFVGVVEPAELSASALSSV